MSSLKKYYCKECGKNITNYFFYCTVDIEINFAICYECHEKEYEKEGEVILTPIEIERIIFQDGFDYISHECSYNKGLTCFGCRYVRKPHPLTLKEQEVCEGSTSICALDGKSNGKSFVWRGFSNCPSYRVKKEGKHIIDLETFPIKENHQDVAFDKSIQSLNNYIKEFRNNLNEKGINNA